MLIELLPRLSIPAPPGITALEDAARRWAADLTASWENCGRPFDKTLLDTALELLDALPASLGPRVLVHQDLHADNVLRARREPWLVIDPKPLAGELEFAVAPIVRGSELGHDKDDVIRRLDRLADGLGLDRERARGWAMAQTLAWAFEGTRVSPHHLRTARWLMAA